MAATRDGLGPIGVRSLPCCPGRDGTAAEVALSWRTNHHIIPPGSGRRLWYNRLLIEGHDACRRSTCGTRPYRREM